jgi:1-acyl-sn-glycerol-3-phosphate acyltransferase
VPTDWKYDPAHDLGMSRRERERSLRREVGLVSVLASFFWGTLTRVYLRLYHQLEIDGRENLPVPPFVMIANHASHLDAIVLAAVLPRRWLGHVFPIAAGDTFFEKPLVSTFAASCLNALPIWRKRCGSHSLEELRSRLIAEGCVYILFPEGTRTRTGEIGPFKPGIGNIVCGSRAPVVPCYLEGTFQALPPHRRIPQPASIHLRIGVPLLFQETPNDRSGWTETAIRIQSAVLAMRSPPRPYSRPPCVD